MAGELRLQIDFNGELDEAFGVAANKQGVRPKDYVFKAISAVIGEELATLRQSIKKMKAEQTAGKTGSKVSKLNASPLIPTSSRASRCRLRRLRPTRSERR